jgi:hypothetical protein
MAASPSTGAGAECARGLFGRRLMREMGQYSRRVAGDLAGFDTITRLLIAVLAYQNALGLPTRSRLRKRSTNADISKGNAQSAALFAPRHSVKKRLLAAADRVIETYRNSEAQPVYENDWKRAALAQETDHGLSRLLPRFLRRCAETARWQVPIADRRQRPLPTQNRWSLFSPFPAYLNESGFRPGSRRPRWVYGGPRGP